MMTTYTIEKVYSANNRVDFGVEFFNRDTAYRFAARYEAFGLSLIIDPFACDVITHFDNESEVEK